MYESHWNLASRPFENQHQANFYYPSEIHQAALLKLRYAIENRRAAAVLCGSSGMGKTLLIQSLKDQLPDFIAPMASLVFPAMEPSQFLRSIALRLAQETNLSLINDTASAIATIEHALREYAKSNRHVVLAIDEAHLLELYGLIEPLRLLLNIGAEIGPGESALTLLLIGQATLLPNIQRNVSLDERIAVRCVLNRLNIDEMVGYIGHRIRAAGGQLEQIFENNALELIYSLTQGVPRRINRLCDLALMVGYAQEADRIDARLIDEVHSELSTPIGADA